MFNWFKKEDFHKINEECIGIHPIFSKRSPTDQDNKGMIPGISFWIKDNRSEFWFYDMDSKWVKLNINQPERSKREDDCDVNYCGCKCHDRCGTLNSIEI